MGDVYASPLGTTVVRHRSVPPLCSALGAFENPRYEEGQWRVRFPTHAAAEEAVEAAAAAGALPGAIAVFLFYNGRPYPARGCAVLGRRRRHHATATASSPRPSPLAGGRRLRAP